MTDKTFLTDDPNVSWPGAVPEISTEDPVLGGPGEVVNAPHQALNDRILFLRAHSAGLADYNAHVADGGAHGATSAVPASGAKDTIVRRDANGRAQVATPAADPDATTKGYVDAKCKALEGGVSQADFAAHVNAGAVHQAASAVPASGAKDLIIRRDTGGKAQVATPGSSDDALTIATKDYVDTAAATKAASSHAHAGTDITSGTVAAARLPAATTSAAGIAQLATAAEAKAQTLATKAVTPNALTDYSKTDHTHSYAAASHAHAGTDITSGTVAKERLPAATTSAAGISQLATAAEAKAQTLATKAVPPSALTDYSKTDHTHSGYSETGHTHVSAHITDATDAATGGKLAKRDADGRIKVAAPEDAGDAANKQYVDAMVAEAGGGAFASPTEARDQIVTTKAVPPASLTYYSKTGHGHDGADITAGTISAARLPLASLTSFVPGLSLPDNMAATPAWVGANYSPSNHNHDGTYAASGHNHSGTYAPVSHTTPAATTSAAGHVQLATTAEATATSNRSATKAITPSTLYDATADLVASIAVV